MTTYVQGIQNLNQLISIKINIHTRETYAKGLRTAVHPLHLIGSYGNGPGIFSIRFNGVYLYF